MQIKVPFDLCLIYLQIFLFIQEKRPMYLTSYPKIMLICKNGPTSKNHETFEIPLIDPFSHEK